MSIRKKYIVKFKETSTKTYVTRAETRIDAIAQFNDPEFVDSQEPEVLGEKDLLLLELDIFYEMKLACYLEERKVVTDRDTARGLVRSGALTVNDEQVDRFYTVNLSQPFIVRIGDIVLVKHIPNNNIDSEKIVEGLE